MSAALPMHQTYNRDSLLICNILPHALHHCQAYWLEIGDFFWNSMHIAYGRCLCVLLLDPAARFARGDLWHHWHTLFMFLSFGHVCRMFTCRRAFTAVHDAKEQLQAGFLCERDPEECMRVLRAGLLGWLQAGALAQCPEPEVCCEEASEKRPCVRQAREEEIPVCFVVHALIFTYVGRFHGTGSLVVLAAVASWTAFLSS